MEGGGMKDLHILKRLFLRMAGSRIWFRGVAEILGPLLVAAVMAMLSGCMNLWTRNPLTDTRIQRCYQSTSTMASGALIVAFPQMMSDSPSISRSFNPWNILTIPAGCLVFCDAACEAVLDTVFLPVDWPLSSYRQRKWMEWQEEQRKNWETIHQDETSCIVD
jgi:uncharacterized protein YceK